MGLESSWMMMVMGLMLAYGVAIALGLIVRRRRDRKRRD